MAFSDFTLPELQTDFGLGVVFDRSFVSAVVPVEPGPGLGSWLKRYVPLASIATSEKARSELIIAPMLLEARERAGVPVGFFSGVELNVDAAKGLRGYCDYLLTLSPNQYLIASPVVVLVEVKNDNTTPALAQCVAEMYAAWLMNERSGYPSESVYGVLTTGLQWVFLRLRGTEVIVEPVPVPIQDAPKILGILLEMHKVPVTRADPSPRATNPTDHHPEPLHV